MIPKKSIEGCKFSMLELTKRSKKEMKHSPIRHSISRDSALTTFIQLSYISLFVWVRSLIVSIAITNQLIVLLLASIFVPCPGSIHQSFPS